MFFSTLDNFSRALFTCLLLLALSGFTTLQADDGKQLLNDSCAACHQIDMPNKTALTLDEKISRKAPPLYYAGHKYRQDWLSSWLQNPQRITPTGGAFWANAIEVTDEGDEIVESKLSEHPALKPAQAEAIAAYLIKLKPFPELIREGEYTPGKAAKVLAVKNFRKFKGCVACHRDEEGFGGVTGPELYTAMNRLQPEFIASYIRNPVAWDPLSLMSNSHLNDANIYKLMNYLNTIAEENK